MPSDVQQTREPPKTFARSLLHLGPGLIVAAAIVGSGELIATTKTGAQAGISLLWLIILGCVIKVFVQVELGRHAICHQQTTLAALNSLPGPKVVVHPVLWMWLIMMAAAFVQLGGILGGVGQAMAMAVPLTGDYVQAIRVPAEDDLAELLVYRGDEFGRTVTRSARVEELPEAERPRVVARLDRTAQSLQAAGEAGQNALDAASIRLASPEADLPPPVTTRDDKYWATLWALVTMGLLFNGRYSVVQATATGLVVLFTIATFVNVCGLQQNPDWAITPSELLDGLRFRLPDVGDRTAAVTTALATFGIIGVGATELIAYPYWCLEKGYAAHTGPHQETPEWAARARGWLRVMKLDAFASMVVYTVATIAFYLTGVAVLHDAGLDPGGMRMISTLSEAYTPVFGREAGWLFLVGAVAVLYSTFLVAIAGQSRIYTDALGIWGLIDTSDDRVRSRSVVSFGLLMPIACVAMCWLGLDPVTAVLISGLMQAFMLPILGAAALYFRYRRVDRRLEPSRLWDVMLWLSCLGLFVAGAWQFYVKVLA